MLYRGMKPDRRDMARPACGDSASTLGVRQMTDIVVDRHGMVSPQSGGMSVVCDNWAKLPPHRKPESHGGESDDHLLFVLDESELPQSLVARQDKPDGFPEHRAIEPAIRCAFVDYRDCLHSTKNNWNLVR